MVISNQDGITSVEISVLIVEDNSEQAISLARLVQNYPSIFEGEQSINGTNFEIKYRVNINGKFDFKHTDMFEGKYAYVDSLKYLNENIGQVDLILCDYYLGLKKGNDFLRMVYDLENRYSTRCYKVLHSVMPDYQKFQNQPHVNFIWDGKTKDVIHTITLPRFENDILMPILFGNPQVYSLVYNQRRKAEILFPKLKSAYRQIKGVPVFRILYMHSTEKKGNYNFYYLNELYEKEFGFFSKGSLSTYADALFIKVSDSLYINKLWYADDDSHGNRIKFLSKGDGIIILNINDITDSKRRKRSSHELSLSKHYKDLRDQEKSKSEFSDLILDKYFLF